MSEARDEAERIVSGVYVHVQAVTSWVEDIEAWEDHVGRVEDVLAAAIEVAHKRDASGTYDADPDCCEECDLILAIGALRARAGEETG